MSIKIFLPTSHYFKLRYYVDKNYVHDRDKHPVRHKHYSKEGWKTTALSDEILYRDYNSYEEYTLHQKQKIWEILKIHGGLPWKVYLRQRYEFWLRFRLLRLPRDAVIYCLGARFGTEVEVLRDLGFKNAIGLDLEPGPNNPYVIAGDFMNIDATDSTVDMIYCNAVDHAYCLETFFKEHARVVKVGGIAIYDLCMTPPGAFEAVSWGSEKNLFMLMLNYYSAVDEVSIDRFWKTVRLIK